MRILIIEDNEQLAEAMVDGLKRYGFVCDVTHEGTEGEELAYTTDYDAILLDLNLPGKDGINILRFLRAENINTPVLITTARDKLDELTIGLDAGADDYITKPFEIEEVRARIQAVTRRFYGRNKAELVIGGIVFSPATREITINQKHVSLQAKEIDILEYIMNRHPAFVSGEEITDHVYGDSYTFNSSVIRVHIANLRKKLRDAMGEEVLFNERGKGYYLWER